MNILYLKKMLRYYFKKTMILSNQINVHNIKLKIVFISYPTLCSTTLL